MKTVENTHPAHKVTTALDYLKLCGEAGARLTADALAGTRSETDRVKLEQFYSSADAWRDADVMDAAIQVARDPDATVRARVYAVMHLLGLLRPSAIYRYDDVVAESRAVTTPDGSQFLTGGCRPSGMASDGGDAAGTPLPRDYASRIRAVLEQLRNDSTTPQPLRNASDCGR